VSRMASGGRHVRTVWVISRGLGDCREGASDGSGGIKFDISGIGGSRRGDRPREIRGSA